MEIVSNCRPSHIASIKALKRTSEVDESARVVLRDTQKLQHFHWNALLMLCHYLGVDHAHVEEDPRHVKLELFLEMSQELAEDKISLSHFPSLSPQSN